MRKMGFDDRWVRLMMICVTTVSYSILINGEPKGMITPSRGIRQGDPLSPFLFLLCTEGLHGLISQAASRGDIKGYALCRNSPRLTHLLFVDDSLLFCRATEQECQKILDILEVYGGCSGQHINRAKPPSSLVRILLRQKGNTLSKLWVCQKLSNTRSIWACHLLWGGGKKQALIS